MFTVGIGEMVSGEEINSMNVFIAEFGIDAFVEAVWHGAFSEVTCAYIHPCDEMKETEGFKLIQCAFINAYT